RHTIPGGQRAMAEILERRIPFSAVMASNDSSAVGAVTALRAAGLSVPEDVAVIGFDDRIEARALSPQLTTVHFPMFELGYQAVYLLLKYLRGHADRKVTIRVPTRLVVRESCGCPPGGAMGPSLGAQPSADCGDADVGALTFVSSQVLRSQLTDALVDVIFNETYRLNLDSIRSLCGRLVAACEESLERGEAGPFQLEMHKILKREVMHEDDLPAWQSVITTLHKWMPVARTSWPSSLTSPQIIEEMLHQARVTICEIMQRRHAQYLVRQAEISDQMNRMTSRFHAALEDDEIFTVLAESLPLLGIRHAAVAFYEAEGDDPVAWCKLRGAPAGVREVSSHFPTRAFPPDGLYDEDEPFYLALLPLFFKEDALSGFAAFDMGNLELCADIAWQLVTAMRSTLLYRRALEGQRLAEEANRLKSRFLSMVSHELRTPLNLISGLSDLLLREFEAEPSVLGGTKREDLARIHVNAQHLDNLIRDVLDLARSEVGQLQLTSEPLDMAEVLEPITVIARQLTREKGVVWRAEIPDGLPKVFGDRIRLRQVALNLVSNAVKFTDRGEVALLVSVEGSRLIITVQDTGLGIPLDEQVVIFDEFRQSERTTARGYGGLGLGLAICKRLVEMHGGEIGVSSSGEVGAGSEFYFILPTIEQPEQPGVACELLPATSQRLMLLVRDVEAGRELQSKWLQQGFKVTLHEAEEDNEWFGAVLAESPSAVIVDQDLAALGGWEILKRLKQTPETRRVPVLLLGGAGRERGALLEVDLLTKPIGTAELGEALAAQGLSASDADQPADKTILIVDDDLGILDLHTRIVQQQSPGYHVLQARNGYEALDLIHKTSPDLVLLDLMMPGLDGFGVLRAMREDASSRRIPVIILTAQTLAEQDMARLNQGIVSVLSKGLFTEEETQQHLEQVLARQRRAASETQGFVLGAMAYIHTHYMNPISRSDIAEHVGVSERHLSRCFRREIGVTPISYLNRYRVRQAKRLLEADVRGITDVALAVGFSSGGYFSRVFRREMGVSPLAYQRGECSEPGTGELS
ncbi:MAG: substrate-binding domain-containing protein, partial [Anaerolineae bacterium]|nr:substrate-binding domain-containing protein [Anaerolineae bacterium]